MANLCNRIAIYVSQTLHHRYGALVLHVEQKASNTGIGSRGRRSPGDTNSRPLRSTGGARGVRPADGGVHLRRFPARQAGSTDTCAATVRRRVHCREVCAVWRATGPTWVELPAATDMRARRTRQCVLGCAGAESSHTHLVTGTALYTARAMRPILCHEPNPVFSVGLISEGYAHGEGRACGSGQAWQTWRSSKQHRVNA